MMRWRLLLEEFHPTVKHIAGKDNEAADALSRLDMDDKQYDTVQWEEPNPPLTYESEVQERLNLLFPLSANETPPTVDDSFPLSPELFAAEQKKDRDLQQEESHHHDHYY